MQYKRINKLKAREVVFEYMKRMSVFEYRKFNELREELAFDCPSVERNACHVPKNDLWEEAAISLLLAREKSYDRIVNMLSAEPVLTRAHVDKIRKEYDSQLQYWDQDSSIFKILKADPYDYEYMSVFNEYSPLILHAKEHNYKESCQLHIDILYKIKKNFHMDEPEHPLDNIIRNLGKFNRLCEKVSVSSELIRMDKWSYSAQCLIQSTDRDTISVQLRDITLKKDIRMAPHIFESGSCPLELINITIQSYNKAWSSGNISNSEFA